MKSPVIEMAGKEDIESIVSLFLLAFSVDPIARWMYPLAEQYLSNYPAFVRAFVNQALAIYCIEDCCGAAFWFPPHSRINNHGIADVLKKTVIGQRQKEILDMVEQMESFHPQQPHWYLAQLAVDPNEQRQGYGSALMKGILEECDRTKTIAYLQSSNAANIPFYEKHGFKVTGKIQSGESPVIYPMLRI